jgi:hypothetical protein
MADQKPKQRIGLQDTPIEELERDSLGITHFVNALSQFVSECDTPMTIAIQGDWGSGKTSLMNLIARQLGDKVITIWFNTWQFSQFNLEGQLPFLMMKHFADEIEQGIVKNVKEQFGTLTKGLGGFARKFGGLMVSSTAAVAGVKVDPRAAAQLFASDSTDPVVLLKDLRQDLAEMVSLRRKKDNDKRLVVFIDDLDRLIPVRAVEVLEVMKLFLEIEGCIFILACDYDVVKKGVEDKFLVSGSEFSEKSFFDKIVQLSFNMPKGMYTIHNYLSKLLKEVGLPYSVKDMEDYLKLLEFSVGFNPRNIKRLINSLILLNIIDKTKGVQTLDGSSDSESRQKILFGIGCMETAFPSLHTLLMRRLDDNPSVLLLDELGSEEKIAQVPALSKLFEHTSDKQRMLARVSEFVKTFVRALDADSDGQLSDREIDELRDVVALTSLTSNVTGSSDSQVDFFKDEVTLFCRKVRDRLEELLGKKNPQYPGGQSRKAHDEEEHGKKMRRYQLWYKGDQSKKAWNQWNLSYQLVCVPSEKSATVSLKGKWQHLDSLGFKKEQVESRLQALEVVQKQKVQYKQTPEDFQIWSELAKVDFTDEKYADALAKDLMHLIVETHNIFDL